MLEGIRSIFINKYPGNRNMGNIIGMREYFNNIYVGILSFWEGLSLTFKHMKNKEDLVATLQYPNEKWPIPERNIGYDNSVPLFSYIIST